MIWPFDGFKQREVRSAVKAGYPEGYRVDDARPDVFDPALKSYAHAFVKGPPADADLASRMRDVRSRLVRACVEEIARSSVCEALVFRGSVTLEAWFPGRARRAHDLDAVVRDATLAPADAAELLARIAHDACDALVRSGAAPVVDEVTTSPIWTYERAEGRRITVPFSGELRDAIQIDVVFAEPLQDEPISHVVAGEAWTGYRASAAGPAVWFASRAESLAWKILWLTTDSYPQGKDLYDAVLLAESAPLPATLLERVFVAKDTRPVAPDAAAIVKAIVDVDWTAFALDEPAHAATPEAEVRRRLVDALRFV